jgi:hypothetical protein
VNVFIDIPFLQRHLFEARNCEEYLGQLRFFRKFADGNQMVVYLAIRDGWRVEVSNDQTGSFAFPYLIGHEHELLQLISLMTLIPY